MDKVAIIEQMATSQVVDLLTTIDSEIAAVCTILDENTPETWAGIHKQVAEENLWFCIEGGRYDRTDKFVYCNPDSSTLFTFSDNATLFRFLSPSDIAEMCDNAGISFEITIKQS